MNHSYSLVYQAWQDDPVAFWQEAAREIDWFKEADQVFNPDIGAYGRWFDGATCNTCYNAVDRHVKAGNGERDAIIYDSPVTQSKRRITYAELLDEVSSLGALLLQLGVTKGDTVVIYMPMVPEALFAALACARIGAVHSVVFGGFAALELAKRIDDCKPKLIVSASCGIEPTRVVSYKPLLDEALEISETDVATCLILQRPQLQAELIDGRDLDFESEVSQIKKQGKSTECAELSALDPLYILYTSGTTGTPKGVVRDNGGHMVALKWTMKNYYDIDPGEVFWSASDIGWVVGHSYILYAPLLHGCTTVVYEGKPVGTPDAGAFWRVIEEYGVVSLFTAPTAFRAVRKEDPDGDLIAGRDLSKFRSLFLAGERADPATLAWASEKLSVPVLDHWWQTETGWVIAGNYLGTDHANLDSSSLDNASIKVGSSGLPMPGFQIDVLDDDGNVLGPDSLGNIACKLPLPPSCLPTLWQNESGFIESYLSRFPGYYMTSDAGIKDADGYVYIMSRTDDIINVAGHRLSTGAIEEIVASHRDVAECAVVGAADALKGQVPIAFYVVNDNSKRRDGEIEAEVIALVRERIGPVASMKIAVAIKRLPKTRSGKILRSTIKKIADCAPWTVPAAIDDPDILDEIAAALKARGFLID